MLTCDPAPQWLAKLPACSFYAAMLDARARCMPSDLSDFELHPCQTADICAPRSKGERDFDIVIRRPEKRRGTLVKGKVFDSNR